MFKNIKQKILKDDDSWGFFIITIIFGVGLVFIFTSWNFNRLAHPKQQQSNTTIVNIIKNSEDDALWTVFDIETKEPVFKVRKTYEKKLDYGI